MVEGPKDKQEKKKERMGIVHPFSIRSPKLQLPPNKMVNSAIPS